MIYRLVFLLTLTSAAALAADPLKLSVLGAAGEPVFSGSQKSIGVVVTNRNSGAPVIFAEICVEKKNESGKFSSFRGDIECPCDEKCKKALISLKQSESRKADWDLVGGHHCEKAEPGVYRFAVIARYSEAISGYVYYGVSKEFIIKK